MFKRIDTIAHKENGNAVPALTGIQKALATLLSYTKGKVMVALAGSTLLIVPAGCDESPSQTQVSSPVGASAPEPMTESKRILLWEENNSLYFESDFSCESISLVADDGRPYRCGRHLDYPNECTCAPPY